MSKSDVKSCDNCLYCPDKERYGCWWRSEIAMQQDKSPCLNWESDDV